MKRIIGLGLLFSSVWAFNLAGRGLPPDPLANQVATPKPSILISQPDSGLAKPLPAAQNKNIHPAVDTLDSANALKAPARPFDADSEKVVTVKETGWENLVSEIQTIRHAISGQVKFFTRLLSLSRILMVLLVILITFFIVRFLTLFMEHLANQKHRYTPMFRKLIPLVGYGAWLVVLTGLLIHLFKESLIALIILLGAAILILIWASGQLFRDWLSGLVLLIERPFQIGNFIQIGDKYGEVKKIGLRSFQILASDGSVVNIPNSEILRHPITNINPMGVARQTNLLIPIPEFIDLETAKKVAFEAAVVSPYIYIQKPVEVLVQLEQTSPRLLVRAYVFDSRYERELQSYIAEQVQKTFTDIRKNLTKQ